MRRGRGLGGWFRVALLSAMLLAAGAGGLFVLVRVLEVQESRGDAIRVSCIILSDKIKEAGATLEVPSTPAGQAAAKLRALRSRVIARSMTAAEILEAADYVAIIEAAGGALSLPPCDEITANPQRVLDEYDRGR